MKNGISITEFVRESLKEIENGATKDYVLGDVFFELSVVNLGKLKGAVDIKVAKVGSETSDKVIQKVRFSFSNKKTGAHNLRQARKFIQELAALDPELNRPVFRRKKRK